MEQHHILIVDDDHRIRSLLSKYLCTNGYFVTSAKDAKEARKALSAFNFDLIILDIMLPCELGTEFAAKLRKSSQIAILMLTAMGSPQERIEGLEAGADDYISKPFEPKELLLRIKKLLYRTQYHLQKSHNFICLGRIKYDLKKNILLNNNHVIPLSSREASLLNIFIQNPGKSMDRELLAEKLKINPRSIDVQIIRLRNKIESDPKKPIFLQTVRGQGYVLHVDR
jgi:two-component system, OmpR family, phosphate regulon response regulator OmpR